MAPMLDLNTKNIELLIRAALLDDVTNTGERLAALLADISTDGDGDAWVTLDSDLWPEDKEPTQAMAVAGILGVELEQVGTEMTMPFHWPRLAQETSSTAEYVSVLLDAYAGRKINLRRQ